MRPVYLHGRSLVSALGADLQQALFALSAGGKAPQRISLPGGTDWPYFSIDYPGENWRARAQQLICSAIRDAGLDFFRDAPLFVASSSFDIGAIETGQA
ncbi:MAG: beta-ketoacyl synthase, partial [Gallionella sp.]|nr:beta-ketoacyl synthase [Gallionella sp.]